MPFLFLPESFCGGSIPLRGQNCKVLRPGSIRFPEDGGDFLRGVVEHIERFGEHHAGDAVGHADVRKGAELPGVEHLLQPEGVGHTNGSFCGAFALFQGDRLRGLQRKAAFGVSAQGEGELGDGCSGHGD